MTHPSIALAAIALDRLRLVRQVAWRDAEGDHDRWIFFDPPAAVPRRAYKLWNPGYVRRDTLPEALERGLFGAATTPGLVALITHRGRCRGYAAEIGRPLRRTPDPGLFLALWRATAASGMYAAQFRRSHVVRLADGRCSLIDLEAAFDVRVGPGRAPVPIECPEYADFVARLAARPVADAAVRDHAAASWRAEEARLRRPGAWLGRRTMGVLRRLRGAGARLARDERERIEREGEEAGG